MALKIWGPRLSATVTLGPKPCAMSGGVAAVCDRPEAASVAASIRAAMVSIPCETRGEVRASLFEFLKAGLQILESAPETRRDEKAKKMMSSRDRQLRRKITRPERASRRMLKRQEDPLEASRLHRPYRRATGSHSLMRLIRLCHGRLGASFGTCPSPVDPNPKGHIRIRELLTESAHI